MRWRPTFVFGFGYIFLVISARGDASPAQPLTDDPRIAAIVSKECGACHQNGQNLGGFVIPDERSLLDQKELVISEIRSGRMPPESPGWANTADGLTLLSFLQSH